VVTTLIPSAQLWADGLANFFLHFFCCSAYRHIGTGKYFAKWFQLANGAVESEFKLLYPSAPLSCLFSGEEISRSCSLSTAGSLNDFRLGLVIPLTTVFVV